MTRWPDWPIYGLEDDLLPAAEACLDRGQAFALATLIHVDGPSPRPLGSEMLVTSDGEAHGYVSGGCVEAAVAQEALACLLDGKPRFLDYGKGSEILDIQLTCGGRIHILVRAIHEPEWWIAQVREVRRTRRRRAIMLDLSTGQMMAAHDISTLDGYFIKYYTPSTRLVLVGSDPVTLATARLADVIGMETVLWRPNGPLKPPAGFRFQAYLSQSADEGRRSLSLDDSTALYCLTHDMDLDIGILRQALASDAFCVGVLGSRSKQLVRRQMLSELGLTDAQLDRLRSPAGIFIGARSPQEIALSILAEVVTCRSNAQQEVSPNYLERDAHALA